MSRSQQEEAVETNLASEKLGQTRGVENFPADGAYEKLQHANSPDPVQEAVAVNTAADFKEERMHVSNSSRPADVVDNETKGKHASATGRPIDTKQASSTDAIITSDDSATIANLNTTISKPSKPQKDTEEQASEEPKTRRKQTHGGVAIMMTETPGFKIDSKETRFSVGTVPKPVRSSNSDSGYGGSLYSDSRHGSSSRRAKHSSTHTDELRNLHEEYVESYGTRDAYTNRAIEEHNKRISERPIVPQKLRDKDVRQ